MDCEYVINSPTKQPITLVFKDFELEDDDNCDDDYVLVTDDDKTLLGKFCGDVNPSPVFAASGVFIIKFHSDYLYRYKGFLTVFNDSQVHQTTDKLPITLSSTSGNTTFTPSTIAAPVNSVVIGAVTGGLIGIAVVIIVVCVIVGRPKRKEKNRLKRKCSQNQSFGNSCHIRYSLTEIENSNTENCEEYSVDNIRTCLETEVYANDAAKKTNDIEKNEVNNVYSYSNLLHVTDDTSKQKHKDENSYHELSEHYNEVQEIETVIKTTTKVETDYSEYLDQAEAYNILNIHPQKINDTENFDRTIEDVYDKTIYNTNTSHLDVGLYDLSTNDK